MARKTMRRAKYGRRKRTRGRRQRKQRGGKDSKTNPGPPPGTYKHLVNCWRCVQDGPGGKRTWRTGSNGCDKGKCPGWDVPVLSAWQGLVAEDPAHLDKIKVKKPLKDSTIKTVADQMNYFGSLFGMSNDGIFS
jgi:hypothetical protein